MINKGWFQLFKRMNPEREHLIHSCSFFTQVNSIIRHEMLPNLTIIVQRYQKYKVQYSLKDTDYIDDILEEFEQLDNESTSKLLLHTTEYIQLTHSSIIFTLI